MKYKYFSKYKCKYKYKYNYFVSANPLPASSLQLPLCLTADLKVWIKYKWTEYNTNYFQMQIQIHQQTQIFSSADPPASCWCVAIEVRAFPCPQMTTLGSKNDVFGNFRHFLQAKEARKYAKNMPLYMICVCVNTVDRWRYELVLKSGCKYTQWEELQLSGGLHWG